MSDILYQEIQYLNRYNGWILWNLFLAIIPFILSFYLFRKRRAPRLPHRSVAISFLWWVGVIIYVTFLPNAPYVLTDIIHLVEATWATSSVWIVTLFYFPLHIGAMLLAFEAYVISLINQGSYLRWRGFSQSHILSIELLTHFLCGIGIYLGRFLRLNSWDIVTDPKDVLMSTINNLTAKGPFVVIVLTTGILAALYWLMKQVTLGILLRLKELRENQHNFD